MRSKLRILVSVFTCSLAAALLQRGAYFYTHDVLGFSQAQNLWLALLVGTTYIAGATASHPLSARLGERRTLLGALGVLVLMHWALTGLSGSSAIAIAVSISIITLLQGVLWPIFESYMSAGETPQQLGRMLSRYNISWALSVPLALVLAGRLIASGSPRLLFVAAASLDLLVFIVCLGFPNRPVHLEVGHVERMDSPVLTGLRGLLVSARFAMLGSYALMYVIAPLMPQIMKNVGFGTAAAARAASLLDVARLSCFVALMAYGGWHGRKPPLLIAIVALPLGFALVLLGASVWTVVAGELLFGAAAGFLYTAALYYAQLVQNASVDAGGGHEALIGLGYALGPSAGLIGTALAHGAGPGSAAYGRGMSIATLPLVVACSIGAIWPLFKPHRAGTPANS